MLELAVDIADPSKQLSSHLNADSTAGPLAEFAALRGEILQGLQLQWNVFVLQLTVTAGLFSFSLSSSSRTEFLLVLPFITYALGGRYLYELYAVQRLGQYIMDELSPRVPGGLRWETWYRHQPSGYKSPFGFFRPLPMIFPLSSFIALAWTAPYVWLGPATESRRILIAAAWVLSLIFAFISFYDMKKSGSFVAVAQRFGAALGAWRHRV